MPKEPKQSLWSRLFPGFTRNRTAQELNGLPVGAGGFYEAFIGDTIDANGQPGTATGLPGYAAGNPDGYPISEMPRARLAKYPLFDLMAADPTIDSALKIHIANALSSRTDTGEIVSIESTGTATDPIVEDLNNSLKHIINTNCHHWAYQAAKYGIWFGRVYVKDKEGIAAIRSDYYTHPRFTVAYEQSGQLAGYTSTWQQGPNAGNVELMEPWKFVAFRMPLYSVPYTEPLRSDARPFDIGDDDIMNDSLTEAQNYGQSLLETAYSPWIDLLNAIASLNMSRKNAAKLERLIGVNTGKLSPVKAAQYLNIVAGQLQKTGQEFAQQSLRKGFIQTVMNHLIPIFGDSRGRLDINSLEGMPNIDGIADVMFHVNRLGSALGVDASILGFGEQLAGGLGDGGFFRVSVLAAEKSQLLRTAMAQGIEQLCDIHVAAKHGKVFLPGEKPWRVVFNSVASAMDREERENQESRVAYCTSVAQVVQLLDQDFSMPDKWQLFNYLFTTGMKMDEEVFKKIFPEQKAKDVEKAKADEAAAALKPLDEGGELAIAPGPVTESAGKVTHIEDYIQRLYAADKAA